MTATDKKYTMTQVEALELAPAAESRRLQGSVASLAGEEDLRRALDGAFDYRGDVTLTLRNGERIEAFIFNRLPGRTLADSHVEFFTAAAPDKRRVCYDEIAGIEFTGKDCAAGKQWEDWVKNYRLRKAAGEKGIALTPEALD